MQVYAPGVTVRLETLDVALVVHIEDDAATVVAPGRDHLEEVELQQESIAARSA